MILFTYVRDDIFFPRELIKVTRIFDSYPNSPYIRFGVVGSVSDIPIYAGDTRKIARLHMTVAGSISLKVASQERTYHSITIESSNYTYDPVTQRFSIPSKFEARSATGLYLIGEDQLSHLEIDDVPEVIRPSLQEILQKKLIRTL